ncbi:MAG TPA: sorbosone dehydrogenase family protein [Balneolaceae bacterium]|nr:sorbosone dehydrogenase family protein [Balneolaceae bacterium]
MKPSAGILLLSLCFLLSCTSGAGSGSVTPEPGQVDYLSYPEGFTVELFAENVPNVRAMSVSPNGVIYAGSRGAGNVYAILDLNNDFRADSLITIASDLNMPVGVDWKDGDLYVSAVDRILRIEDIDNNLQNPPDPVVVTDQYPTETHHGWKYIAFGPDDKLYVPVGAPCNICEREEEIFSTITRINPDGSEMEIVAQGVRNSVGFDWHPETGELWFTENGRDMMGDNIPPDELNRLEEPGQHFGYPYLHGNDIWDPEFGEKGKELDINFTTPVQNLGPHVAALGMLFYKGEMFPDEYRNQILIAEHGSWNRSEKIGYRVTLVRLEGGEAVSYEPFVDGWLQEDETVLGRPVDLVQLRDGSLLVSDDHRNKIYRISYNKYNQNA